MINSDIIDDFKICLTVNLNTNNIDFILYEDRDCSISLNGKNIKKSVVTFNCFDDSCFGFNSDCKHYKPKSLHIDFNASEKDLKSYYNFLSMMIKKIKNLYNLSPNKAIEHTGDKTEDFIYRNMRNIRSLFRLLTNENNLRALDDFKTDHVVYIKSYSSSRIMTFESDSFKIELIDVENTGKFDYVIYKDRRGVIYLNSFDLGQSLIKLENIPGYLIPKENLLLKEESFERLSHYIPLIDYNNLNYFGEDTVEHSLYLRDVLSKLQSLFNLEPKKVLKK